MPTSTDYFFYELIYYLFSVETGTISLSSRWKTPDHLSLESIIKCTKYFYFGIKT